MVAAKYSVALSCNHSVILLGFGAIQQTILASLDNFIFFAFFGVARNASVRLIWWMGHITVWRISLKVTRSSNFPTSVSILNTIACHSSISEWHWSNITILLIWWASSSMSKLWIILTQSGGAGTPSSSWIPTSSLLSLSSMSPAIMSGSQIQCPSASVTVLMISFWLAFKTLLYSFHQLLYAVYQSGIHQVEGQIILL